MSDEQNSTRAELIARLAAEYPYVLNYTRHGGSNTAVGFVVGSRPARSREEAEVQRRLMESVDDAYGHSATYEIAERAAAREDEGMAR